MTAPVSEHVLIGRMLMVGIRGAHQGEASLEADIASCADAHVGGVILFDVDVPTRERLMQRGVSKQEATRQATRNIHSPMQVRELCAYIRAALGCHTLIAVDQEGGAVARLSPDRGFKSIFSAADFAQLGEAARADTAETLAEVVASCGFNLNFAPCVDLAVNPESPVIARLGRSYGADPDTVVACAQTIITAQDRWGIASCLKHFPGHGSAGCDSHATLPDITDTFQTDAELDVYRRIVRAHNASPLCAMTGHLLQRTIDPAHPASLSYAHTTTLLREQLGFQGVVVTDSIDMAAITQQHSIAEACVLAVNAGADIVLHANNLRSDEGCPAGVMHDAISRALRDGRISGGVERLRASWDRINALVQRCG